MLAICSIIWFWFPCLQCVCVCCKWKMLMLICANYKSRTTLKNRWVWFPQGKLSINVEHSLPACNGILDKGRQEAMLFSDASKCHTTINTNQPNLIWSEFAAEKTDAVALRHTNRNEADVAKEKANCTNVSRFLIYADALATAPVPVGNT